MDLAIVTGNGHERLSDLDGRRPRKRIANASSMNRVRELFSRAAADFAFASSLSLISSVVRILIPMQISA